MVGGIGEGTEDVLSGSPVMALVGPVRDFQLHNQLVMEGRGVLDPAGVVGPGRAEGHGA